MFDYTNENEQLSIEDLCEKLLVSRTTAYKLVKSGEIKSFKLGSYKIPAKFVDEYIQNKVKT